MRTVLAADLFAGAGGASTSLRKACDELGLALDLLAINHWPTAVETHTSNHPTARHLCEAVDTVNPREVVPGGRLNVLLAGPSCVHFSRARGGRPVTEQARSSAWSIVRWCEELYVDAVLVENVPEFLDWCPVGVDGRAVRSRKGATFAAWVGALKSLGYHVEHRVLNAADYGDPTTRHRLFIQARRDRRRIEWPSPSHSRDGGRNLFGSTERWLPARDVIDWSLEGQSIFSRRKPLSRKTMARILDGLERISGQQLAPFLVILRQHMGPLSIDQPCPTIAAQGTHVGLCQPFVLPQQSGGSCRPVTQPLPTIAAAGAQALIQPFISSYYSTGGVSPVTSPLPTITARDRFGLVMPQVNGQQLDIQFRMLQPHELSAAMSFPTSYRFAGTKRDKVRQIGNAWPVSLGTALCKALVSRR
ncbi:MAG: DNA cytosine methyltransferase [Elusimicrobiota bacterium]|jgi:DNA (cytosine-5)-methyltransferase 1